MDLTLGADSEAIDSAEQKLGITLPSLLKETWELSNGLELPGGWILFPVFDPTNPRKTCSNIVHENKPEVRFDYMPDDLVAIAGNGTGNLLVLRAESGALLPDVLVWNHETNKTRTWGRTLADILSKAAARVLSIERARAKSIRRS
jgi:hypothetical protein